MTLQKRTTAIGLPLFILLSAVVACVVGQSPSFSPVACATIVKHDAPPRTASQDVEYQRDIAPILRRSCLTCHGPDEQESNFRVDRWEALSTGGDTGEPAVVPGESDNSPLVDRVNGVDGWIMPPEGKGKPLSAEEIARLRAWIDAGAKMPAPSADGTISTDHWSFQPIVRPAVPQFDQAWTANPIDAFVFQRLRELGLTPSPLASRADLIRRVYLDVLGLLPSPEEVAAFVADDSPSAYDDLVDRVLASPHYGERWARHWLDVVGFAESNGFETNQERPNAYHYRDWVIRVLNDDLPYDQFVVAQLAGDAVGQDAATGFLVSGAYDVVKSPDPGLTLRQRQDELAKMINTTGTAFLGLTTGCARCHTHKFDPILQADYYELQAVFAGVQHAERPMALSAEEESRRAIALRETNEHIAQLQRQSVDLEPERFVGRLLVIDDEDASLAESLAPPRGHGQNPDGTQRGYKNDPGEENRYPNISGGRYSWWDNKAGEDVFAYRPRTAGRWRVWLSWGCGWDTHSPDAEYVLDDDGDPATVDDQTLIAHVNQQRFAAESHLDADALDSRLRGNDENQPLWSGFLDAETHEFGANSAIIIRGGQHGQAITADVVVLQQVAADKDPNQSELPFPPLAPPANARMNVERFAPTMARFVRFTVEATNVDARISAEPCLDELEIWSAEPAPRNVALASEGTIATSSGNYAGDPKHRLEHVNDGRYSNNRSWISSTPGGGWVQLELAEPTSINRIVWGRDRSQVYADRLATKYRIEVSIDGANWETVADHTRRAPHGAGPDNPAAFRAAYFRALGSPASALENIAQLESEIDALQAKSRQLQSRPLAYAGAFVEPPATHRLYRGDPMSPLEEVAPEALEVLKACAGSLDLPSDAPEQQRRINLANWITSPDNPLTPRVIVNRIWQHHFGTGIVDTPSDLGAMGGTPTHPELLDWLASELVEPGTRTRPSSIEAPSSETPPLEPWSLKHIHKLILLSNAYRQSSAPRTAAVEIDRGARFLWRFPPRRLEAEIIRDNILLTSGQLDETMHGPGFLLFHPNANYSRNWIAKDEFTPDEFRRMIYATDLRMEHDAVFGAFDCPDGGQVAPRRPRSTTPIQALNLFNSNFMLQQAEAMADRIRAEAGEDPPMQVRRAFSLALLRDPHEDEAADAVALVSEYGLPAMCRALLNSNEFLFIR